MENYKYKLFGMVNTINCTDNQDIIYNNIKIIFNKIYNNNVLEIFVFLYDELMIKKFNNMDKLMETEMFNSSSGGNKFFHNLQLAINNYNLELIQLYYFAIKLGFTGQYEKIPINLIEQLESILNINKHNPIIHITFNQKPLPSNPHSFMRILYPIILLLILFIILDIWYFQYIIIILKKYYGWISR